MTAPQPLVSTAVERLLRQPSPAQSIPLAARIAGLAGAARLLVDPESRPGAQARALLPHATGLSPRMIDWALRTSLRRLTEARLRRATTPPHRGWIPVPPRLVSLILAGNVFTAGVPPMFLCLLYSSALLVKVSRREEVFAGLVADALRATEPRLADCVEVLALAGTDASLDLALQASDRVIAYGSDATIAALRNRLPPDVDLIGHGHGVSVAYVAPTALNSHRAAQHAAGAIALDVAAYDQRGCLSPQTVFVPIGQSVDGRAFATLLHQAMAGLERRLPRGELPPAMAAAQMQWRGVAAATAEILDGGRFATVIRADRRWLGSCGGRNIEVVECSGSSDLVTQVAPLGTHLKAIGVAGTPQERALLAAQLEPPLCPRVCRLGTMQQPDPLGSADGLPSHHGILRWIDSKG